MIITNLVKRALEQNFVQFVDGKLIFKDGVIDINDPVTPSGSASIPVIAYASDLNGANFSLVPSASLQYIAITVLSVLATPVAADFAGKWQKWKGDPGADASGAPGTNGEPGGIRMNYSTVTTAQKPGTGKIMFNNTNIALATEMYIDEMMPSGVDLSGFWLLLTSGWYCMVKPATNLNSPLAMIKFTAAAVDNADWFKLTIEVLSMSSATFADGDKLVLQFFGGGGGAGTVDEAAILAAGNFMRHASNGAGGYKMLDKNNVEIKAATQTFKLPGFTITGVSNLPAANTFPHCAVVRLHQDCLVGVGASSFGAYLQADAINNRWRPFGPQILFWKEFGLLASPSVSLTAVGKFNLGAGGDPIIPAGLLYDDSRLRILMTVRKVGTTSPTVRANFGTDMAARENNSLVYTQSISATDNFDIPAESLVSFITATSARCGNRIARGGGGSGGAQLDATTLINVVSDMKLTLECSVMPASTTVSLFSFGVILEG